VSYRAWRALALPLVGSVLWATPALSQQQPPPPGTVALLGQLTAPYQPGPAAPPVVAPYLQARVSQLRFCYTERGYKQDPTLTGFLHLTFHLTARLLVDSVATRSLSATWRGAAAARVEACVRDRFRAWRFPDGARPGTYFVVVGFAVDPAPPAWPRDWAPKPPTRSGGIGP
jgi:hypothetical protein